MKSKEKIYETDIVKRSPFLMLEIVEERITKGWCFEHKLSGKDVLDEELVMLTFSKAPAENYNRKI